MYHQQKNHLTYITQSLKGGKDIIRRLKTDRNEMK